MPKELKQIRRTKKAVYPDTQEYLGKQSGGEDTIQIGEAVEHENESEITGHEEREGRSPEGILGDLPPEIQEYVENSVARTMQMKAGRGENGEGADIQYDENGDIIGEPVAPAQVGVDTADVSGDQTIMSLYNKASGSFEDMFDAPLMSPELQEKLQSFKETLDEIAQEQAQKQPEPQKDDSPDSTLEDFEPSQGEPSQDSSDDSGQDTPTKNDSECTQAERAFLDSFMALQEAGALLGMIPSTRFLPKILDFDVGGIRNVSILPTVASMNEEEEQEAHTLLKAQAQVLFESCEKMLQDKGIK